MKQIRAIIIDDEEDGREALHMATKYCPEIEVADICGSALAGLNAIEEKKPDLVFLDIQMPHMSGFEMLQQLESIDFQVIFVTAFDQYAIKAIKFSALDYLLKPVDIDELQAAVKKIFVADTNDPIDYQLQALYKNVSQNKGMLRKFAVPTLEGLLFLNVEEIIYCEAERNYTTLYLRNQRKQVVSKSLGDFEELLSGSGFYRIHHSFLVNMDHIQEYVKGDGGYVKLTDGHHADVSRRKKEQFLKQLQLF
ncbi:MAG: LytR/AlgR family response regulator transcription factor [Flavobacteriaceae bacterium]